jgi:hypothetical protein
MRLTKIKLTAAICLLMAYPAWAQLTITSGGQLVMTGNAQLTLQNSNMVNHGSFTAGNGTVLFNGNAASSISGTQPIQFYELSIGKTASASVSLLRSIGVVQRVSFNSGFLHLNGFDTDLGTTGVLLNEQEGSRIIGPNGGQVLFSTVLNNPVGANPGNLGAIISSGQNLGTVVLRRGHQPQVNGAGAGSSILRYYDILPANNTALDATLRFHYFDAELNGLAENGLILWKSPNNLHWSSQQFTSRNTISNYVEKTGITDFSRWTLSSVNNPLPVRFVVFNVRCENNRIIANWTTAQEQNSSHFILERSSDGVVWTVAGTIAAAGNSTTEKKYSFTDHAPLLAGYYRIAQYDMNGAVFYSGIIRPGCAVKDMLTAWPNPVLSQIFVQVIAEQNTKVFIKVYDSKGSLSLSQQQAVMAGSNQLTVDMNGLSAGTYHVAVEWNSGNTRKIVSIIKQ